MNTRSQSAGNEEVCWLCGFIDGEGCLRLMPKKQGPWLSYIPVLQATNTHIASIEKVFQIFSTLGIGCYVGASQSKGNRKSYKYVRVEGMKRLESLLPILLPFLCTKREQARLLLEFIHIRRSVPIRTPYGERELQIYQRLKELNFRGSSETTRVPLFKKEMI